MIKNIMEQKHLNMNQLSEKSGVGYNYIYKIVNGITTIDKCGLGTAKKIADTLNITLEELYEIGTSDKHYDESLNIKYYKKAALHSRYNADHWFRYLRKFIIDDGCKLSDNEINILLNSSELTMYQKITLKRALIEGSKTNIKVLSQNKKAKTPMLDQIRRKSKIIKKLEIPSPKEMNIILEKYDFNNIDESIILEVFGEAYGMEWLEKYYVDNIEPNLNNSYDDINVEYDDWDDYSSD